MTAERTAGAPTPTPGAAGPARVIELVLYVRDTAAAAAFLVSAAGLTIIERDPDFTVLLAHDGLRVALRPQHFSAENAAGGAIAGAPPPAAELVLACDDVAAAHARAVALGAECLMAASRFSYGDVATVRGPGGLRITWFARAANA